MRSVVNNIVQKYAKKIVSSERLLKLGQLYSVKAAGARRIGGESSMPRSAPVLHTLFFIVFFGLTLFTMARFG